uniref:Uncharacterized protein n=1 Tax=Rhizophora mucronata TaxID=61149 RepID=A0A2P2NZU1_RHIMU
MNRNQFWCCKSFVLEQVGKIESEEANNAKYHNLLLAEVDCINIFV